jgi:tetratricopeptide (TPR) repeat protein
MGGLDVQVPRERVRLQPGSFPARLALGQALLADGALDEAEGHLREALRLFPAYPGLDGPLAGLSRIHRERGETLAAANALRRLASLNENAFQVSVTEAGLRRELNDDAGELAALERAVEIYPFVADHHERLAQLYETAGDTRGAVVERRAVLALDPPNRADAHYQLARAHLANGDRREARSQILRALELAPTFGDALDLLLEIRGGGQ